LDVFLHFSLLIKPYNKTTQGARKKFFDIFLTLGYKIWLGGLSVMPSSLSYS